MAVNRVQAADRNTVVATGWTNPTNAYGTATDASFATAVPGKNGSISSDYGFPALSIPTQAVISAVRLVCDWKMSALVTGGTLGILGRNNGVNDSAAEVTKTSIAEATSTFTFGTLPSVTDLNTAGRVVARIRCAQGNTSSAMTGSLDFIRLEVDYTITISPTGGMTPAGAIIKTGQKFATAGMTPAGAVVKTAKPFKTGGMTPAAALTPSRIAKAALTGAATPSGAEVARVTKALAAGLTPTGALPRTVTRYFAGGLTPAATVAKAIARTLAGALVPTGALIRSVRALATGGVSPAGALGLAALRYLAGTIAGVGSAAGTATRTLAGAIAPAGSLRDSVTAHLAGTAAPAGQLRSSVALAVVGAITPTGTTRDTVARQMGGTLAPSATVRSTAKRVLVGVLVPVGVERAGVARRYVGALVPAGTLRRSALAQLAGALEPAGVDSNQYVPGGGGGGPQVIFLTGGIAPAGDLGRRIAIHRAGALHPVGGPRLTIRRTYAGSLIPAGELHRLGPHRRLGGGLTPASQLAMHLQLTQRLTGSLAPFGDEALEALLHLAGTLRPRAERLRLDPPSLGILYATADVGLAATLAAVSTEAGATVEVHLEPDGTAEVVIE